MPCDMIFENESGILTLCILPDHDPADGHCDGDECYLEDDYELYDAENIVESIFFEAGLADAHGLLLEDVA